MKFYFSIITLLFSMICFSQQEANIWYFGNQAGISFASGSPVALTNGQLATSEGCAVLSNTAGNLMMYTDGQTIYNANHQVMTNGGGLFGNWSSSQSATIVPKPGNNNLFYVFTLDSYAGVNGFCYSVVDISLDGGLGAVTSEKNILVYTPSNEKLAVVKHTNGTDYWIVTHGWNNNTFNSHLLTSSGLSALPVQSSVGIVTGGSTDNVWGCMKIAPNGSKLAICNALINAQLFDFDVSTGMVSNPLTLHNTNGTYGVDFQQIVNFFIFA